MQLVVHMNGRGGLLWTAREPMRERFGNAQLVGLDLEISIDAVKTRDLVRVMVDPYLFKGDFFFQARGAF